MKARYQKKMRLQSSQILFMHHSDTFQHKFKFLSLLQAVLSSGERTVKSFTANTDSTVRDFFLSKRHSKKPTTEMIKDYSFTEMIMFIQLTMALHQRQRQSCSRRTLPQVLSHTVHLALTGRFPSNH